MGCLLKQSVDLEWNGMEWEIERENIDELFRDEGEWMSKRERVNESLLDWNRSSE